MITRFKAWRERRRDQRWIDSYFAANPWNGPRVTPGIPWDQPDADPLADMRAVHAEALAREASPADLPPLVVPGWFTDAQLSEAVEWLKTSPYRFHYNGVLRPS